MTHKLNTKIRNVQKQQMMRPKRQIKKGSKRE
ncbi:hypothetical protein COLO4_35611 [Corchorus olitorius]|uniref:Uncharacterized protein n=1 Tax=Corchorus olitorius TaxID=93759 RepID=A0A1R3GEQ6_9ROSI|nr:hypothetical protein COLO4_35611 [Corchorus olitorius]